MAMLSGHIAAIDGRNVIIDLGANRGVQVGQTFDIIRAKALLGSDDARDTARRGTRGNAADRFGQSLRTSWRCRPYLIFFEHLWDEVQVIVEAGGKFTQ